MKEEQGKKKIPLGIRIILAILAILFGIIIAIIIVSIGTDSNTDVPEETQATMSGETQAEITGDQVLIDNEYIKVSFEKLFEAPGIDGVVYMQLKYENKTDNEVWVYLDNSSINGEMLMTLSGVPTTIVAGKFSRNPVFYNFPSIEDVENIEFEVVVENNETSEEIFRSEPVKIEF